MVNTAFMMGGALGLAVLASLSDRRTESLTASGHSLKEALTGGYHLAFGLGALFAFAGAVLGGALLQTKPMPAHSELEPEAEYVEEAA
jgi:hypothetical protein